MLLSRMLPLMRLAIIVFLVAMGTVLPRWILSRRYADRIFEPHQAPARSTAIVLGAGLRRDGTPTRVLADRVSTAVSLYHAGKVNTILMSGSVSPGRDEPAAMQALALELGVPEKDILVDPQGNRTYETCVRAKQVYGIKDALVVTQRFHLPRTLILCESNDVDVLGVSADLRPYRASLIWSLREIPATYRALWDVYVHNAHEDGESTNAASNEQNCG